MKDFELEENFMLSGFELGGLRCTWRRLTHLDSSNHSSLVDSFHLKRMVVLLKLLKGSQPCHRNLKRSKAIDEKLIISFTVATSPQD